MNKTYSGYDGGDGCGCGSYDISMVDKIMLKYRPIAPKPVASGSSSSDSLVDNGGKTGRAKRRYVKRKIPVAAKSPEGFSGGGDAAVTLALMPETPDGDHHSRVKKSPWFENIENNNNNHTELNHSTNSILWFENETNNQMSRDGHVTENPKPQTVSFVTVGRVTETRVESGVMEWEEMERDTCPRFISDGGDRVVWVNKAYREMAAGGDEVVVVLVRMGGSWPAAFTCNVRVTCRIGVRCSTLTVPCDAWRMGGGGYAWGLDVKAALCLGR